MVPSALIAKHPGKISLSRKVFAEDFGPLEEGCDCPTCKTYTRYRPY